MSRYNLQPNEYVILKQDDYEYMLTNLNILLDKGIFKKGTRVIPIDQIKVYDGRAQVLQSNEGYQLDIYFINGEEHLVFDSKKVANQWMSNINSLVMDSAQYIGAPENGTVATKSDSKELVEQYEFTKAFGFNRKPLQPSAPEFASGKCKYCGTPISGGKGQIIRCSYCGGDIQISRVTTER
jgi:hypothetical protein